MREGLKGLRTASGWRIENKFPTELRLGLYASGVALVYAIGLIRQIIWTNFAIGIGGKDYTESLIPLRPGTQNVVAARVGFVLEQITNLTPRWPR